MAALVAAELIGDGSIALSFPFRLIIFGRSTVRDGPATGAGWAVDPDTTFPNVEASNKDGNAVEETAHQSSNHFHLTSSR